MNPFATTVTAIALSLLSTTCFEQRLHLVDSAMVSEKSLFITFKKEEFWEKLLNLLAKFFFGSNSNDATVCIFPDWYVSILSPGTVIIFVFALFTDFFK